MAKYGPSSAFLLVGGNDISGDTTTLSDDVEGVVEDTRGLRKAWDEFSGVGLAKATLEASGGIYDDRTVGIVEALQGLGVSQQLVMWGLTGSPLPPSSEVYMTDAAFVAHWSRLAAREGLTKGHGVYTISGRLLYAALVSGFTSRAGNGNNAAQPAHIGTINQNLVNIGSPSVANPTVFTVANGHDIQTGDIVFIYGGGDSTPVLGGHYVATVISPTQFSIPVNVTAPGTFPYRAVKSQTGGVVIADLHVPSLVLGPASDVVVEVKATFTNDASPTLLGTFPAVSAPGTAHRIVAPIPEGATFFSIAWAGTGGAPTSGTYVVGVTV